MPRMPLFGKAPPAHAQERAQAASVGGRRWEMFRRTNPRCGRRTWPDAINTGVSARLTPALDLDLLNGDATPPRREDYVRERFEEGGYVLTRIGRAAEAGHSVSHARAVRGKIVANLVAPNGSVEKIEFLADGQQVACFEHSP